MAKRGGGALPTPLAAHRSSLVVQLVASSPSPAHNYYTIIIHHQEYTPTATSRQRQAWHDYDDGGGCG